MICRQCAGFIKSKCGDKVLDILCEPKLSLYCEHTIKEEDGRCAQCMEMIRKVLGHIELRDGRDIVINTYDALDLKCPHK